MSAAELRAALAVLELSNAEFARRISVNRKTVTNWTKGHRPIPGSVRELVKAWFRLRDYQNELSGAIVIPGVAAPQQTDDLP